jgi:hypothetical protein
MSTLIPCLYVGNTDTDLRKSLATFNVGQVHKTPTESQP